MSIKQRLSQPENLNLIGHLLADDPALTRAGLTKALCRRLDLRDPKGDWQIGTTAKALRDLEAQGGCQLPKSTVPGARPWNATRLHQRVPPPTAVPARVDAIRGLQLIEVSTAEHLQLWNELMLREHPLHQCRLVGRQLRYLVGSEHGWLGAIGFGSAALALEDRDVSIGWNAAQRIEHLPRVLNMNRLLIRPQVRCDHLASHVLGLCARRVADDFERRYGLRPWLLESFVDHSHYAGACYKAANWIEVGQTKGRGRNGRRDAGLSRKAIYLYPLVDNLQERLGIQAPPVVALDAISGLAAAGWAEQEFGDCELGDLRRTRRVVKIVGDQAAQPSGSYAQAAGGNRHALKGYYRLLNCKSKKVTLASLLQTHRTQTIRRMKRESTVLIVQDTTELNLSTRPGCEGLGQIGSNQTRIQSRGLDLHSCLAVGESGLPLGVVRLFGWAPESAAGKDPHRPIQEKESYRWLEGYAEASAIAALIPSTQVISVADREGDMFELFDWRRRQRGPKAELLVRAQWDRCLEDSDQKLFAELAAAPLSKTVSIPVPRQREHRAKAPEPGRPALPARTARVEVRFKEVSLRAPEACATKEPIKLWAISLVEKHPPKGATPVRWLLLTSIPITSVKQALKCVRRYCRRWRIEEWHRVLKSGCNILDHQNHRAHVLLRAIALDAVIAWRIMLLALLGRAVPELPAEVLFDPVECEVLGLLAQKKKKLTLGEAMIVMAQQGGYLNRKCDGPPGFESLWRGYARFYDMVHILRLRKAADAKRR